MVLTKKQLFNLLNTNKQEFTNGNATRILKSDAHKNIVHVDHQL
jgi:hypothetical protein